MKNKSFNNNLLVSMPHLNDTIFDKSVILICEHNNDGSMGFIINKPIDNNIVIKNISNTIDAKLYFGGPVSIDSFFVLHDNTYQIEETKMLIRHLGLDWEKRCLSPQENTRSVNTASSLQVRKKVYQVSSQKWKKFKPFLNGALDYLDDSLT